MATPRPEQKQAPEQVPVRLQQTPQQATAVAPQQIPQRVLPQGTSTTQLTTQRAPQLQQPPPQAIQATRQVTQQSSQQQAPQRAPQISQVSQQAPKPAQQASHQLPASNQAPQQSSQQPLPRGQQPSQQRSHAPASAQLKPRQAAFALGADEQYVKELTTFTMHRLAKEPSVLVEQGRAVQAAIEELSYQHYPSFLNAYATTQFAHHTVSATESRLDSLLTRIPTLTAKLEEAGRKAQAIAARQRLNRIMIEKQGSLAEVLDIPTVVTMCIRVGMFEEVLEVESYVRGLANRHPEISLFKHIVKEVESKLGTVLALLLQSLREKVSLSASLKATGVLRRLDLFTEQGLRVEFLRCRTHYLEEVVAQLGDPELAQPHDYLGKYVEAVRVGLLEVVTHYRAIFIDDNSTQDTGEGGDGGLLFLWATTLTQRIVDTLRRLVPLVSGPAIAGVLDQAMYTGLSLARVGIDFRGLLPPIFESHILDLFQGEVNGAVTAFEEALDKYEWYIPSSNLARLGIPTNHHGDILEHPPLGVFFNHIIAAFNSIRQCVAWSLKSGMVAAVESAIQKVAQILAHKWTKAASLPVPTPSASSSSSTSFMAGTSGKSTQPTSQDASRLAKAFVDLVVPAVSALLAQMLRLPSNYGIDAKLTAGLRVLLAAEQQSLVKEPVLDKQKQPTKAVPSVKTGEAKVDPKPSEQKLDPTPNMSQGALESKPHPVPTSDMPAAELVQSTSPNLPAAESVQPATSDPAADLVQPSFETKVQNEQKHPEELEPLNNPEDNAEKLNAPITAQSHEDSQFDELP